MAEIMGEKQEYICEIVFFGRDTLVFKILKYYNIKI